MDINQIERICFFLGSNRSGSSLLRSILNAHSEICMAHEVGRSNLYRKIFNNNISTDFALSELFNNGMNASGKSQRVIYNDEDSKKITHYNNNISDQYQNKITNLKVIGDKSGPWLSDEGQHYEDAHERLEKFFDKDVKYIHMIRNPLKNLCSVHVSGDYLNFFKWNETTRMVLMSIPDENVMNVFLEELVYNTKVIINNVCKFLKVDTNESYLESAEAIVSMRFTGLEIEDLFSKNKIEEFKSIIRTFKWYDIYKI